MDAMRFREIRRYGERRWIERKNCVWVGVWEIRADPAVGGPAYQLESKRRGA